MRVVSNTTPLRYLIAIEQEHLLGQLFEKVFVPAAVHETNAAMFPVTLHRGERQSILLAEIRRADVLLIDEQIGRTIARSRNLPLSGTLGVLERADRMGFVSDFPQVLRRLKLSGFFITEPWSNSSWNVIARVEGLLDSRGTCLSQMAFSIPG
jgi:uncharacterized protein